MGLVIRTLYNNQDWKAPCQHPGHDPMCAFCIENKLRLNIGEPSPGAPCPGECWEQVLCVDYFWGCTPKGKFQTSKWGARAHEGMKVFFVFRQIGLPRLYTLWGKTTIKFIASSPNTSGAKLIDGYYLIYFYRFAPAPASVRKPNLTSQSVVGGPWGSGNYRYVNDAIQAHLDSLIP